MPFDPEKLLDVISMTDPVTGEPVFTAEQVEELEQQIGTTPTTDD